MNKMLLLSFFAMILVMSCSPNCSNYIVMDNPEGEDKMIVGQTCIHEWEEITNWKSTGVYNPNPGAVHHIANQLKYRDITFVLVGASWCSDSENEMPKLFELFKKLDVENPRIKLYGVDRSKNETTGAVAKLGITKVPTLIVFEDGKEIGRIVETPLVEWEEDLLPIINK